MCRYCIDRKSFWWNDLLPDMMCLPVNTSIAFVIVISSIYTHTVFDGGDAWIIVDLTIKNVADDLLYMTCYNIGVNVTQEVTYTDTSMYTTLPLTGRVQVWLIPHLHKKMYIELFE